MLYSAACDEGVVLCSAACDEGVVLVVLYSAACDEGVVLYSGTSLIRTAWDQSLFRIVKCSD